MSGRLRSFSMAPLLCAIGGGVLALGTLVGQEERGRAPAEIAPMSGMDHSAHMGGSMDHSSHMPQPASGAPAEQSDVGQPRAEQPAETPTMDMSQPGMAATMPGGVHAQCATVRLCTAIFAQGAIGTASVAGSEIRLLGLAHGVARLDVDGRRVAVRSGKVVRVGQLTLKPIRMSVDEVAVQVTRRTR